MGEENDRDRTLFIEWEGADEGKRSIIVNQIACSLILDDYHLFADILASTLKDGTLEVSGWTREAVKAALTLCAERNLIVKFKNGDRTVAPVTYPKEDPMLDIFVKAIMTGEWI